MSGFTKLVPEIVVSSIWNESPEVRVVWITMLAVKDQHGNVRGNRKSLARVANVPLDCVDVALDVLLSPDPDSNSPAEEGRRIIEIQGGWHVVNHEAYREKSWREAEAERKRIERENKKSVQTCPDKSGNVTDASVSVSVSSSVSDKGGCKGGKEKQLAQPCFNSPAFISAWNDFLQHRKEKKKPMTPKASEMQMDEFRQWGESRSIAAIQHTIRKGWQGIREPEETLFNKKPMENQI